MCGSCVLQESAHLCSKKALQPGQNPWWRNQPALQRHDHMHLARQKIILHMPTCQARERAAHAQNVHSMRRWAVQNGKACCQCGSRAFLQSAAPAAATRSKFRGGHCALTRNPHERPLLVPHVLGFKAQCFSTSRLAGRWCNVQSRARCSLYGIPCSC